MKQEIKLIAMDMDGTIFTDDKTISSKTIAALTWAKQQGIRIALASGRSPHIIYRTMQEYHMESLIDVIIGSNGGHIIDYTNHQEWNMEPLHKQEVCEILERCAHYGIPCFAYTNEEMYVSEMNEYAIERAKRFHLPIKLFHECMNGKMTFSKVLASRGIGVSFTQEEVQNLRHIESSAYYGCLSCDFTMEYMRKGTSKGHGVQLVCEANGFTIDEVMAFGDYENDLDMIEMVKVGVAMGNGCDSVKQIANYITDDNNHDGIANMIERYFEVKL